MKIIRRDGTVERKVLIGMIVDKNALGQIAGIWKKDNFRSKFANIVGNWCVSFYEKYQKAPAKSIEGLFHSWAEGGHKDKDTVRLIDQFLTSLSDEYANLKKQSNTDWLVDQAAILFNTTRALRHAEKITGFIDSGELDKALAAAEKFDRADVGRGKFIDVLRDKESMRRAFEMKTEPLIKYPGALGEFFGDSLERDGFIALMGPEKSQKTWWLIDMAWRAMQQRRKVAFFEIGDLSEAQIMRRLMTRAARHPTSKGKILYPLSITIEEDGVHVEMDERNFKTGLTWKDGYKACEKILKRDVRSNESYLNLSVHPNSSISVKGITSILKRQEKLGWTPDIVVIDYADILDHGGAGNEESRDRINASWKQMRALSQEYHCLVLTATQAKATAYTAKTLDMSHFSEDKRKFAHVTGMISLNRTKEERAQQVTRMGWLVRRESNFEEGRCVNVAGCLSIGNPAIKSTF